MPKVEEKVEEIVQMQIESEHVESKTTDVFAPDLLRSPIMSQQRNSPRNLKDAVKQKNRRKNLQ